MSLDSDALARQFRASVLDLQNERLLITRYTNTVQEQDFTQPPNCGGFGRIRHFRRQAASGWVDNPLPIEPASKALALDKVEALSAQVFQVAACNWRCWYCFVPFELLAANRRYSEWFSAGELLDAFLAQGDPPMVLDLSGGEPSLVPEWILWTIQELRARGLEQKYYLWSDDNLSNDYFWRFLSVDQQRAIATYRMYGRVGCFKGFDAESFAYTTRAHPERFAYQFGAMQRLIDSRMDVYAYVTFVTESGCVGDRIPRFVDRLQAIHENLPLRTIPLETQVFSPVGPRLNSTHRTALKNQWLALDAWRRELDDRFSPSLRALPISEVPL